MDSKVGIITFSASDNCGSLLQAYALQEYIASAFGAEVYVLDFVSEESAAVYSLFPRPWFKHPKKTLFSLMHYRDNKKQHLDYEQFRKNYLRLTPEIIRESGELREVVEKYQFDLVIAGSDQIWNASIADFSKCFFLPGKMSCRKVGYAVSLGGLRSFPREDIPDIKKYLDDFDALSTREEVGARLLKDTFGVEASLACDPTILHDEAFWRNLAGPNPSPEEPFIFFYSWAYMDREMNQLVQKFSNEVDMPVYVINPTKWYRFRPGQFGFRMFGESGPSAFLSLMAHAEYVFVQSFHGIVLANILKKNYCFLNEQAPEIDPRAEGALGLFDQKNRIASNYDEAIAVLRSPDTEAPFPSAASISLVAESKRFLEKAFGGL